MAASGFLPGSSYNHTPAVGDVLLFPPWAVHSLEPSTFDRPSNGHDGQNPLLLASATDAGGGNDNELLVVWAFNFLAGTRSPRQRAARLRSVYISIIGHLDTMHD